MTSVQPRITIVTPTYNQGQYIEQTIRSIIEQDYENVELIIIDGGSTDNTLEVIKKYESQITYWVSETDKGQADAINKGLKVATGNIFNWLNSDDYLASGALRAVADAFRRQPGKKIICGYTRCFYDGTDETSHTYKMGVKKKVSDTLLNVEMNQPGSYYSMEAIRSLNGVNPTLRYVFDDELWFRFLCKYGLGSVGFIDKLIAHFRLHKNSKTVGEGFFEFYKELLNIHLFIAKQVNIPERIINYLVEEQYIERYKSFSWDLAYLEKDHLCKLFADKYKFLLYKDKAYNLSRLGLKHSVASRNLNDFPSLFFLGLKLVIPDALLEKLREKKNRKN